MGGEAVARWLTYAPPVGYDLQNREAATIIRDREHGPETLLKRWASMILATAEPDRQPGVGKVQLELWEVAA